ncbi:MAG: bifunctional (p)ppGpp synthetase/guanosine-3',5'-bis(diphosphate) 3'-pyrophosphohydrolase, partial [Eggerthellaceae bacterium]|nr:bifunctional (p)ppGpp synthetase/guanosine-3',5'-bis(diphosphate) 3'-pyrophosphohydrolase [Eggerthellaceae bacterium]
MIGRPYVAEHSMNVRNRRDVEERRSSTPEERFEDLFALTEAYMTAEDCEMLVRAFEFASEAHKGQCRKSGEPFVIHPIEVGIILADLRMDAETICAALLHDTVEDTDVTPEQVEEVFNDQVRQLV